MPRGQRSPACSAIVQQFTRGQSGQQAPDERSHPPARLDPGEPAADAQRQLIEFPPPALQVYAEASGHRTVFCCPHLRIIGRWPCHVYGRQVSLSASAGRC